MICDNCTHNDGTCPATDEQRKNCEKYFVERQKCRDCREKMEFVGSDIGGEGSITTYVCKSCNLKLIIRREWLGE